MLMNNEMEQKKEYVEPQMKIVQFQPQGNLLECSPNPCSTPDDLGERPTIILDF